ncbi:MAG: hypothetical protein ABL977_15400 [Candidatus Eisenbacteria bacterium]
MPRRSILSFCMLALMCLGLAVPSRAHGAEVQMPFDANGRVNRIDEPLARRLGLFFNEYEGFREARLFMADDSSYVLEITHVRGGQSLRERQVMTREQADAFRADFAKRMGETTPLVDPRNQEGRPWLMTSSALLGLGFYGWALPYVLDVQDGSQVFGSYMLTAGASFFVPLMLTSNSPVTTSAAGLYWYGGSRGIAHGVLLADALDDTPTDNRSQVALAMGLSLAESIVGYEYATHGGVDGGAAQAIAIGGDFGFLWGYTVSDLASTRDERSTSGQSAAMLAGSVAGMISGRALATRRAYSFGDGTLIRTSGGLGMLVGTAIADAANSGNGAGDSDAYSAGLLLGSFAGLAAGDRLVEGRDFSGGDGVLMQLGTSLGALMGLGVVAVADPHGSDNSATYWLGSAAGGVLGYAITYSGLSRRAVTRATDSSSGAWRVELAPEGIMAALGRGATREDHGDRPVPVMARVSCRF